MLAALIHSLHPTLFAYEATIALSLPKSIQAVLDVASSVGIPPLLSVDNLVVPTLPDALIVETYVSSIYDHWVQMGKGKYYFYYKKLNHIQ